MPGRGRPRGARSRLDACDGAPHVGHGHPRVVETLTGRAGTLDPSARHPDERILECTAAALTTVAVPAAAARAIVNGTRERGAPGRTGRLDNLRKRRPPMPSGAALDDTPAALP